MWLMFPPMGPGPGERHSRFTVGHVSYVADSHIKVRNEAQTGAIA